MRHMTADEARAFLSAGTRTGKLATVREDGRPHVAPIWFVVDDNGDGTVGDIVFNTQASSVKGRNLARDGRACLTVDDQAPPYSFVMVEGTVELTDEEDPEEKLRWATRIGGRYMGADRAEEYGRRNGVPGEYLVRLTPTNVVAIADMAA